MRTKQCRQLSTHQRFKQPEVTPLIQVKLMLLVKLIRLQIIMTMLTQTTKNQRRKRMEIRRMKEEMDQLVEMVLTGHRWHDDSEMDTRCGS